MESNQSSTRLNKAIAQRGFCSRRKADDLILAGRVKINGVVVTNPATQVASSDHIEVDDEKLGSQKDKIYLLLHKPVHCVSTVHDPQNRKTVLDYFPPEIRAKRIFPVGRLDYFSEGLLFLTNDGDFAYRLTHPSFEKKKGYEVVVRGNVSQGQLSEIRGGMTLSDGTKLAPIPCKAQKLADGDTCLAMELTQGLNRQIRRMCEKLNLTILKLKRVSEGGIELGDLGCGKFRHLSREEIERLKK